MRLDQLNHETPSNSVWEPYSPKLRFVSLRSDRETEFPQMACPNGVWERGHGGTFRPERL
jgi:hypothetical protein